MDMSLVMRTEGNLGTEPPTPTDISAKTVESCIRVKKAYGPNKKEKKQFIRLFKRYLHEIQSFS